MFGLFGTNKNKLPVDDEIRHWMEQAFNWLVYEFGQEKIKTRKLYTPDANSFPFRFDGTEQSAYKCMEAVAGAMELEARDIEVTLFSSGMQEMDIGIGNMLYLQQDENNPVPAGEYHGKNQDGKYEIQLNENILKEPEKLVATIAHELAHIKLLGEGRLSYNDEHLTDLVPVIFGFGIFNANSSFSFNKGYDKWSYSSTGYLLPNEWGYALALLAYYRGEEKPEWIKYLNKSIRADFLKCEPYIREFGEEIRTNFAS